MAYHMRDQHLLTLLQFLLAANPLDPLYRRLNNGESTRHEQVILKHVSYDKQLEQAIREAPILKPRLKALRNLHSEGVLSEPDACVAYIMSYLQVRHKGRWLAGRRNTPLGLTDSRHVPSAPQHPSLAIQDERLRPVIDPLSERDWSKLKLRSNSTLKDIIEVARFLKVPEFVFTCLTNYYVGRRPLKLLWRLPSPQELMEMQAIGRRCVSALTSDRALNTIFGHRGCLEMLIHDLAHMEHFVEAGRFWQQVGFFEFLHTSAASFNRGRWSKSFDNRWRLAWNYISSDMNAIVLHMFQTLKWQLAPAVARAVLRDAGVMSEEYTQDEMALEEKEFDINVQCALEMWEPTLAKHGLIDVFRETFSSEWDALIAAHVSEIVTRYPAVFGSDHSRNVENLKSFGCKFDELPRPSSTTFARVASSGIGQTSEAKLTDEKAAALIAHFDELGRQKIAAMRTGSLIH